MAKNFWKGKRVLVTGGAGFIGSHVVEKLVEKGANASVLDNLQNGTKDNLRSVKKHVQFIAGDCQDFQTAYQVCRRKDIVMNLAARVGGIEYNRTHQGTMLRDNLSIATVMMEAARRASVERFLVVSSACVYPRNCSVPTPESEGFLDQPEPTNGGYGWAKRMSEKLGMHYNEEFGIRVAIVRPYNCYGSRDHFGEHSSHVIPALIKRVFDEDDPLVVWGSGRQTRAFLYVDDLANGMLLAVEKVKNPDPINLGTDEEVSIRKLAHMIVTASGRSPRIVFDTAKPDGSLRRNSDNRKAKTILGFSAKVGLEHGLEETIAWYRENR